jgi:TolA-binding protein
LALLFATKAHHEFDVVGANDRHKSALGSVYVHNCLSADSRFILHMASSGKTEKDGAATAAASAAAATKRINELKEAANVKYKAGDYAGAIAAYTKGVEEFPDNSVLLQNRAAAALMLKK